MKSLKAAFPYSLPVLAGYLFLGIAFGLVMDTHGYPVIYSVVMSVLIYAGALEFAAVPLLAQAFNPVGAFFFALMINARHIFYGLAMLPKYKGLGRAKWPLAFMLTDETFSILSSVEVPDGVDKKGFYFWVSILDYSYWVGGTALGALFGKVIPWDLTGLDFSLSCLFIVMFIEQAQSKTGRISGFTGAAATFIALLVFGKDNMVVAAMILIVAALLPERRVIERD